MQKKKKKKLRKQTLSEFAVALEKIRMKKRKEAIEEFRKKMIRKRVTSELKRVFKNKVNAPTKEILRKQNINKMKRRGLHNLKRLIRVYGSGQSMFEPINRSHVRYARKLPRTPR